MSNGKKKGEGNTGNGYSYLCWAFIEADNFAMHFGTEAKQFYEHKKARTHPVIARKALANKLACACFKISASMSKFKTAKKARNPGNQF